MAGNERKRAVGTDAQPVLYARWNHRRSLPTLIIPDLGRYLAEKFPQETTIFCNFDTYWSVLPYYAQRTILTSLTSFDFWKDDMAGDTGPFGGIIWVDAPEASDILAAIPKNEVDAF